MGSITFHSLAANMDIIDNYDKLRLGKYMDIQAIANREGMEEIDRQIEILAILADSDPEEIGHLPIGEYKEMVAKAAFLSAPEINLHPIAKKYLVGSFELYPVRDFRKLETCQYVDFQTYAPDLEKYLPEFLSVILVPKGHRYNEGYDILDVQKAIREDMSVADGISLAGFFLTWCRKSILSSLNSSKREALKIPDKTRREKILEKINRQLEILGESGGGSTT